MVILPKATKVHLVKAVVFPVDMYGCESWTIKKVEPQRTDAFELVLEKTLESPLDCREIQPVNPKGNQSWAFIGRTDAEAEAPILWSLEAKSQLIGKDPDAGKDWGQEEKGTSEDQMVGWHHQLMDREAWCAAFHWVTKCQTALNDWTELIHFPSSCTIPSLS